MSYKDVIRISLLTMMLIGVVIGGLTVGRAFWKSKPLPEKSLDSAEDLINKQMGEGGNYQYTWFLEQSERIKESKVLEEEYKKEYEEYKKSLKGLRIFYSADEKRELKTRDKKYKDILKTTDKLIGEYNTRSGDADPEIFGGELKIKEAR